MEIIALEERYEKTYCMCLEDWSEEMVEAGDYKCRWLEKKKEEGLRVKLARSESGDIVGMIHYAPIEQAPVLGRGLYYIYCIWVHGYKEGVGNRQNMGVGKLLLEAAEKDCRELGAKGIVAWGITMPFFLQSKWFKKYGYKVADEEGGVELVWKPFSEEARQPELLRMKKRPPVEKGVVTVTCFRNGWCPAQNLACERVKRAVAQYTDGEINYVEIDTDKRENMLEWGLSDAIFIDAEMIEPGPPPTFEKLQELLRQQVERLERP